MLQNKYTKAYYRIIAFANEKNRSKKDDYFERHHIIPKSIGGSNDVTNLVLLTPREHFICHLLLTKMTEGDDRYKMLWALHRMAFTSTRLSSHQYALARKQHIKFLFENHPSTRQGWSEKVSSAVKTQWANDPERRVKTAKRMTQIWADRYDEMKAKAAANFPINTGKDNPVSKDIEYNGHHYFGWRELKEATGISKHLYCKYYTKGIDPSFRIGTNGPVRKESL